MRSNVAWMMLLILTSVGFIAGSTMGATYHVEIDNFEFTPQDIDIMVGDTIVWHNNDSAAHTVTEDGGEFDSGNMDPGDTFQYTFDTADNYTYACDYHPSMTGSVDVDTADIPEFGPFGLLLVSSVVLIGIMLVNRRR